MAELGHFADFANSGRRDSIRAFVHFPKAFVRLVLKMMGLAVVQMMIAQIGLPVVDLAPAGQLLETVARLDLLVKRRVRKWRESVPEVFSF